MMRPNAPQRAFHALFSLPAPCEPLHASISVKSFLRTMTLFSMIFSLHAVHLAGTP
jgi:hypothetical protein